MKLDTKASGLVIGWHVVAAAASVIVPARVGETGHGDVATGELVGVVFRKTVHRAIGSEPRLSWRSNNNTGYVPDAAGYLVVCLGTTFLPK